MTETSNALDLEPGVFQKRGARAIAESLKRSADQSHRRKADPFRSAMSMLTFYINRAGKALDPERRRTLEAAKDELRVLYGRAPRALPTRRRPPSGNTSARDARRQQALLLHNRLSRAIPAPRIELDYDNAWQLLIATILSAQSTDIIVNHVTRELFRRFPTPQALAAAPLTDVEAIIKPTGFFHNKARAIRAASAMLVERFGGEVPREIDELVRLPGVGRKTANVVLGSAYGIASGIMVDRHVARVARRLGLTSGEDAALTESILCTLIPRRRWIEMGIRLQLHGRYVCTARAPRCANCPVNELCPSRRSAARGSWVERAHSERLVVESGGEQRSR